MISRDGISVAASTLGQAGTGYEHLAGGYRWRKVPGWTPGDVRFREPQAPPPPATVAKAALRAARIREFRRYRQDGLSIPAAGRRVGITPKTAYVYERDSKALGEAAP